MSYVVEKVLETIHDYTFRLNNKENRTEICYKLSIITGYSVYFSEKYLNEIHGDGIDLFNLSIDIDGNIISLFTYLKDYKLYDRPNKIKNIINKLDDK